MQVTSNRLRDIISYYSNYLKSVFSEQEARFHLYWIIEHVTGIPSGQIALHPDKRVNESELLKIHFAAKDLARNKPIQYIVGRVEFANVVLELNQNVLIPRPETEELVGLITRHAFKPASAIDIGTGSGAIAIALSMAMNIPVTAIEKDKEALKTALGNAIANKAKVYFMQMDFLDTKLWDALDEKVDLIVSNPPYVRHQEKTMMSERVMEYEPHLALFVEDHNPLVFYKAIAGFAKAKLSKEGHIWLEINEYLAEDTARLFEEDYQTVEIIEDFRGKNRFVHVCGRGK